LLSAESWSRKAPNLFALQGWRIFRIGVSAVEVSRKLGIPVLDPGLLSVKTAEMLVSALDYCSEEQCQQGRRSRKI
jgi:hypothetical protein